MSGSATVSGNSAPYGGGVDVTESGTFTMNGNASVSGNTASNYGGGVYVSDSRTFTMNGGRIQGSGDSDGFTKNTAPNGAALYRDGGTAKFGAASTNCKVGATDKTAGADIGSTDETITATGTGG
jgi:parallel beta-helix repeat protein